MLFAERESTIATYLKGGDAMAGPFAAAISKELARRHPNACIETLNNVRRELDKHEAVFGTIPTGTLALSRDHVAEDASLHRAVEEAFPDNSVLFYELHRGRVGDVDIG